MTGDPDDHSVTVSWNAPALTGTSPIISYTVTSTPGSFTCTTAKTSCTVDGLTNGASYTFVVTAINSAGVSLPSTRSAIVEPGPVSGPPGIPTISLVSVGDGEVDVTVLAGKGGVPDYFTVTSLPDGQTCKAKKSTCTVDGLANGKDYTFTARATNSFGTSDPSDPSKKVTPIAGPPGIPVITSVKPDDEEVDVRFVKGRGGKPTTYTVTASPGGSTCITDDNMCPVTDLTNGVPYTFTVTATNAAGTSAKSEPSLPISPTDPPNLPGLPSIVSIVVGDRIAEITLAPGAGSTPDTYIINSDPDDYQCTTHSNVCVITGLDNGKPYTFTAKARNEFGTSKWSAPSRSVVTVERND